jgi:hypothetical protein
VTKAIGKVIDATGETLVGKPVYKVGKEALTPSRTVSNRAEKREIQRYKAETQTHVSLFDRVKPTIKKNVSSGNVGYPQPALRIPTNGGSRSTISGPSPPSSSSGTRGGPAASAR